MSRLVAVSLLSLSLLGCAARRPFQSFQPFLPYPTAVEHGHQTVEISVHSVDKKDIVFQPLVTPEFFGMMEGDEPKDRINKCDISEEDLADLAGGGKMKILVLKCGETRIVIQGVIFH